MPATVPLYARQVGQGPEDIVILHGVFGSGDNWGTFIKPWATQYKVHLVDLRNHGRSPHAIPISYELMAADVAQYITANCKASCHIIGHSMGGKTAMYLAWKFPQLVKSLAVIDIAPRQYPAHHQLYIQGMRSVDPPSLNSRAEAETRMAEFVKEPGVRQFLLKNLGRSEAVLFEWKHNLEGIAANIDEVGVELPQEAKITCPLLFVRGTQSGYIQSEDEVEIKSRFPQAQIVAIDNAGHWIQVENPNDRMLELNRFLVATYMFT